jgi:hypothetical protein
MSELRDLTTALRAISRQIISLENCMLTLVRDSQQQSEWRHEQKNRASVAIALEEERDQTMQQVQKACGALYHELSGINQRLDAHAETRLEDVRALHLRVSELEKKTRSEADEETTKP